MKEENELVCNNQESMVKSKVQPEGVDAEELAAARLKIKALETMIAIAEEQYKIDIRKKPGAKQ